MTCSETISEVCMHMSKWVRESQETLLYLDGSTVFFMLACGLPVKWRLVFWHLERNNKKVGDYRCQHPIHPHLLAIRRPSYKETVPAMSIFGAAAPCACWKALLESAVTAVVGILVHILDVSRKQTVSIVIESWYNLLICVLVKMKSAAIRSLYVRGSSINFITRKGFPARNDDIQSACVIVRVQ